MKNSKTNTIVDNKNKKRHIISLALLMFVNMIGFTIIMPILPGFFTDINSPHYFLGHSSLSNYGFIIQGFVLMIYALFVFLSAPVLGQLSDYYGRKKILNICLLGSAVGYFLFAYAILTLNLWLLIISRIIDGITGGNVAIMQASMGDISEPAEVSKNVSKMQAMVGVGFIFGPLIGGILSSPNVYHLFNASTPLIFAGALSLFSIYLSQRFLIEVKHKHLNNDEEYHKENRFSIKKLNPLHSFKIIKNGFKIKEIKLFLTILLLFWIGFSVYNSFSNNFLSIRFGLDEKNIGYYFAAGGIMMVICQLFIVPMINKLYSSKNILRITYPILSLIVIIHAVFIFNIHILYLFLPIFVLLVSLNIVNTNVEIMSYTTQENRGKIFGITSSLHSMGQTVAPIIGGAVATLFYYESTLYLAAIIIFIAGILLWSNK